MYFSGHLFRSRQHWTMTIVAEEAAVKTAGAFFRLNAQDSPLNCRNDGFRAVPDSELHMDAQHVRRPAASVFAG